MKELSLEKMENIEGGKCPWWSSSLVGGTFALAAAISGPGAVIIGPAGLLITAAFDYGCSLQQ
jgi:hypothetical protein